MATHRRLANEERRRVRSARDGLVSLFIAWLAAGALLAAIGLQNEVPVEDLLLDATVVSGTEWYVGMLTSLTVLGWSVAVMGCAATAYVAHLVGRTGAMVAFRSASFVFALLLFDDLFLLHSSVFPRLFNVSKTVVLAAEMVIALLWLVPSRLELARTRWSILLGAAAAFGASIVIDVLGAPQSGGVLLAEDGAKLFGVAALATWAVISSCDVLASMVDRERRVTVEGGDRRQVEDDAPLSV